MTLKRTPFGTLPDGRDVDLFRLANDEGMSVSITTYGGRITQLHVPDASGRIGNVALGFDQLQQYLEDDLYFGPIVGRYALRIAGGEFVLDGIRYDLPKNENGNTLHGGPRGFSNQLWTADPLESPGEVALRLTYFSPHLEEGFPGDLIVSVTYTLTNRNELRIRYIAHTDRLTPVSFTSHIYMNLSGAGAAPIDDHRISIRAPQYLPTDAQQLPTGQIDDVRGTALDLNAPARIGDRMGAPKANIDGGFDHWYVLDNLASLSEPCVRVEDPQSERVLELFTSWPGLQFYTANKMGSGVRGIGGLYTNHCGFTLEPMNYPDPMHHANFPTALLAPGDALDRQTIFRFTVV
jgi:aldose 1-epimerase